ncbi:MAG: signal peptide protein [Gammaproteobacteria bacterium (ex Lamellibrachia satsuma)]|nr:MAG: FHA domain-containing protein [Gammaproteobacteria bacterium (ex Lamellibrachia satsuma)]RRS33942.1 MAG: signal peptide protein [Gammaproteobacteria bacterium (ex Lamellibrachia satsuma)]RRS37492.1 MAG: signal peptide protein [Gammaproteobacteria bacterium (ex Lamellibrachia satsuma)]
MPKLTLSFKGRIIDVHHLAQGDTLIGRDTDCTLFIDSLAVAPKQILIKLDEAGSHLIAQDNNHPVLINHKVVESTDLVHGDVIQIGKHTLSYAEDALEPGGKLYTEAANIVKEETGGEEESWSIFQNIDPATATDTSLPQEGMLQIMSGDHIGRIIPLNHNLTRIGRAGSDCAIIALRNDGYFLSHLEGPVSPSVNDEKIGEESRLLQDGDLIHVGGTEMQFHLIGSQTQ